MKEKSRPRIRVFLVDDHPIVREGVRAFLASQRTIDVVGEASDAKEALRKVKRARPDVVVLDVNLPDLDGGELALRLRQLIPLAKLVAFSVHDSEEYVVRMARCGVSGYVMKDTPTSHLLGAIIRVFEGGLHFPPGMNDAILASRSQAQPDGPAAGLSARERDVLSYLAEGLANKAVAAKLGISVRTVETHREHLSKKLKIPTVAGLTKYAIEHGFTTLKL